MKIKWSMCVEEKNKELKRKKEKEKRNVYLDENNGKNKIKNNKKLKLRNVTTIFLQ